MNSNRHPATAFGLNPCSAPEIPRIDLGRNDTTAAIKLDLLSQLVPINPRSASVAPASRNEAIPILNFPSVSIQRMRAQNKSTPKMTPDTLPRLSWISNVACRLTPVIARRRPSEAFIGEDGMRRPVDLQTHSQTTGRRARTTSLDGVGNKSAGASAKTIGNSAVATKRTNSKLLVACRCLGASPVLANPRRRAIRAI